MNDLLAHELVAVIAKIVLHRFRSVLAPELESIVGKN